MATVAICTSYQPSNYGSAAVRLADMFTGWGLTVFFCDTSYRRPCERSWTRNPSRQASRLSPRWDSLVARDSFQLLATPRDLEVWLTPLPIGGVQQSNIPYIVVDNDWFLRQDRRLQFYEHAARIICPDSDSFNRMPERFRERSRRIPWDCGLPPVRCRASVSRLLLPMHHHYWRDVHLAYLKTMLGVLRRQPQTTLTVLLPAKPPLPVRKLARRLYKLLPAQVQLKSVVTQLDEWLAFCDADLVLWPADRDTFCTITQLAIAAGAAICTWSDKSHQELVGSEAAGLLVPAKFPLTADDHASYVNKLDWLLQNPQQLLQLRLNLTSQQSARRERFARSWAGVIQEVLQT